MLPFYITGITQLFCPAFCHEAFHLSNLHYLPTGNTDGLHHAHFTGQALKVTAILSFYIGWKQEGVAQTQADRRKVTHGT